MEQLLQLRSELYDDLLTYEVAGISVSETCTAGDSRVCAHEVVGWKQGFCCDMRIWELWCIGGEGGFGGERSVVWICMFRTIFIDAKCYLAKS